MVTKRQSHKPTILTEVVVKVADILSRSTKLRATQSSRPAESSVLSGEVVLKGIENDSLAIKSAGALVITSFEDFDITIYNADETIAIMQRCKGMFVFYGAISVRVSVAVDEECRLQYVYNS